jgi:hypothetical protein
MSAAKARANAQVRVTLPPFRTEVWVGHVPSVAADGEARRDLVEGSVHCLTLEAIVDRLDLAGARRLPLANTGGPRIRHTPRCGVGEHGRGDAVGVEGREVSEDDHAAGVGERDLEHPRSDNAAVVAFVSEGESAERQKRRQHQEYQTAHNRPFLS